MLLRFIGKDGSMGLKHGKKYNVTIGTSLDNRYITVTWTGEFGLARCPYSSPQSFAANWEK
jgi:hypothetical protein